MREGLPEPLAVTARWDEDPASDESTWQEEVIAAIGARNWEIIRPGTDLDLLGEEATALLRDVGLLWPAPAYAFLPMIRMATGGVFLTGEGGDEAFGLWPYGRLWSALRGGRFPRQSDLRALALGCAPRPLRRHRWRRNLPPYQHWLQPAAFELVADALAGDQSDDPLRFDRYQLVSRRRRAMDLTAETLERLCEREGAAFAAPFLDEGFLASLAAWGGPFGRGDRTQVMTQLFADVLPGAVLARTVQGLLRGRALGPPEPTLRRAVERWGPSRRAGRRRRAPSCVARSGPRLRCGAPAPCRVAVRTSSRDPHRRHATGPPLGGFAPFWPGIRFFILNRRGQDERSSVADIQDDERYEVPTVTVLGGVTEMTQAKPGIYFDFPGSSQGNKVPPPPGAPGTTS